MYRGEYEVPMLRSKKIPPPRKGRDIGYRSEYAGGTTAPDQLPDFPIKRSRSARIVLEWVSTSTLS